MFRWLRRELEMLKWSSTHGVNFVPNNKVSKQRPCRVPLKKKWQEIQRQIEEMFRIRIIYSGTSKFASLIALVKKGSNKDQ